MNTTTSHTTNKLRKVAILRYVWSLNDEEISWLDSYFLLRAKQSILDEHTYGDKVVYKGIVYDIVRLKSTRPENLLLSLRYNKQLSIAVMLAIEAPANISENILNKVSEFV